MKQTYSATQLFLYYQWFEALMAAENPPAGTDNEGLQRLLDKLARTRAEAIAAKVPGIL